jgi:hypothetical protein
MKKALSIGLAATIAVSAIAVSAAPASAHRWHRNDGAGLAVFGAVLGLAAIAAANQHRYDYGYYDYRPYPGPYYGYYGRQYYRGYNPHVAWCLSHYRSYNPATNTYFVRRGVPAVCYSPY